MLNGKKVTLVLGGGGMKGLAHIGVLKALQAWHIEPDEYVGTSVGAFICALAAGGLSAAEIESVAVTIRKPDILDSNLVSLLWKRGDASSLYRGRALHDFVRRTLPVDRFEELTKPLYMTAVNLTRGEEVIWGMPGLTQVPIHDCVVASCSIPGIYPPKKINRYYFVDGSVVDTLPIKVAVYLGADLVIGVYLDSFDKDRRKARPPEGIADVITQSQSILSRTLVKHNLRHFQEAPLVLVVPKVSDFGMFQFERTAEIIQEGERAAYEAFWGHPLLDGVKAPESTPTPLLAPPKPRSRTAEA
ncbi:MAG: patatin-like phospholipase family protein [Planctomycetes bacterium]|nr:patatin-like phospholipase family protein [Planctomycetota bacterium]